MEKNKAQVLRLYVIVGEKYSYLIIKKYFINNMEIGKKGFELLWKEFQEKKFKILVKLFSAIAISIFVLNIFYRIISTAYDLVTNYICNWNIKLSPFLSNLIEMILILFIFIIFLIYSFKNGIRFIKSLERFEKIKNIIYFIIAESLVIFMIYKMGYYLISSL